MAKLLQVAFLFLLFIFGMIQMWNSWPLQQMRLLDATDRISCQELKGTQVEDDRTRSLMHLWETTYLQIEENVRGGVPLAPHMEECSKRNHDYLKMDMRDKNSDRPRWTRWKGMVGVELGSQVPVEDVSEELFYNTSSQVPFVPWIDGADDVLLPMTRTIQRDFWLHQHPRNCYDPSHRFILLDFSRNPNWGLGAQLHAISGMIAVAMTENRIFVTQYFNRADHEGCKGSGRSHWTCYFISETSDSCRERALELANYEDAWKNGSITNMSSYPDDTTWSQPVPRLWGEPWKYIMPTAQIDGVLLMHHLEEDERWWRSQTLRYLTRFPSTYLCKLLNHARHEAFGEMAAQMVLKTLAQNWPEVPMIRNESAIERLVWSSYKPWTPKPLTSIHVRQGDKAIEMKLYDFKAYMDLAQMLRTRFPEVHHIWLSTEMESVIDEAREYEGWKFYYTNVTRQRGATSMRQYETTVGRQTSSNNAFVNLMMAGECDFFVGALGSTWVLLIDSLRNTNGKAMAGLLSVNKGIFW